MSRHPGSNAARISRHVAAGLAGLVLAAPADARADGPGPAAAVLMIGNSGYATLPKLPGCVPAMRSLSERLRAKGADVSEQFDAPGPSLQAAIGSFAVHLAAGQKAAIVYCGYVAADADKLFILPVGTATVQPADLPRQAIVARTLSRVLSGHDSVLVAEMHPAPGAPDLANAVQGLREASAMSTYLDLRTVDGAGSPQIDAFSRTVERSAGWPYQAGAGTGTDQPPATTASAAPDATAGATGQATTPAPTEPDAAGSAKPEAAGSAAPPGPSPVPAGPASSSSGAPASPPVVGAAGPVPADHAAAAPAPARSVPGRTVPAKPVAAGPAPDRSAPGSPVPDRPAPDRPAPDRPVPARPVAVASSAGSATGSGTTRPGTSKPAAPPAADPSMSRTADQKRSQGAPGDAQTGSPSIRRLQVSLLALGYYNSRIDGLASPATQAAVRAYQRSLKHPETGFLTYGESTELEKVGARR